MQVYVWPTFRGDLEYGEVTGPICHYKLFPPRGPPIGTQGGRAANIGARHRRCVHTATAWLERRGPGQPLPFRHAPLSEVWFVPGGAKGDGFCPGWSERVSIGSTDAGPASGLLLCRWASHGATERVSDMALSDYLKSDFAISP